MRIDYQCTDCLITKTNDDMESFVCACGGSMSLITGLPMTQPQFNAGWCDTLKCEVTSWKDQEKKAANHRSRSHPRGFSMIQDNKKWMAELKNIKRHKGDYMKAELPGFKTSDMKRKYDQSRPDIHRSGKRLYSYSK